MTRSFNEYRPAVDHVNQLLRSQGRKTYSWETYYPEAIRRNARASKNEKSLQSAVAVNQLLCEERWLRLRRPYYNVWPRIVGPLCRVDLSQVLTDHVRLAPKHCAFRFAERSEALSCGDYWARSALVNMVEDDRSGHLHLAIYIDVGEVDERGHAVLSYRCVGLQPGYSIAERIDALPEDEETINRGAWTREIGLSLLRLVVSCCLLSRDPSDELVSPDVLTSDRQRWDNKREQALVDRAHRRGKVGWDIGRYLEQSPHYRVPHLCTFHVGAGRQQTVVKLRKGSLIHREVVEQIPSGLSAAKSGETT
jgi:hypothetical protein